MNFNISINQTFLALKVFHCPYHYENFKSQNLVIRTLTESFKHKFQLFVLLRKFQNADFSWLNPFGDLKKVFSTA